MSPLKMSLRRLFACLMISSFFVAGCGEGSGHETVYIHVFNGYPGSQQLSLYGPTGPITTGLGFGERTEEPVPVDRNLGSEFTLMLDGAPQTFELSQDLFVLYPQETATFFVSRRQDTSATMKMFRHLQSISPDCRLVIDNSLAVSSDPIGEFGFIASFDHEGIIPQSGYDEDFENANVSGADERPGLYEAIAEHPYFVLGESEGEEELLRIWIGPEDRIGSSVDFESGTVTARPPTVPYIQCLEDAAAAQDQIDEMDPGDVDPELLEAAAVDCDEASSYGVTMYSPDDDGVTAFVHYPPQAFGATPDDEDGTQCNTGLKLFSDFDNIFTGEHGYDGYEDSQRIEHEVEFGISDHYFFVLYGRPVNPLIESWVASDPGTGGGFEEMEPYPDE